MHGSLFQLLASFLVGRMGNQVFYLHSLLLTGVNIIQYRKTKLTGQGVIMSKIQASEIKF
jgi:hypothetical protein